MTQQRNHINSRCFFFTSTSVCCCQGEKFLLWKSIRVSCSPDVEPLAGTSNSSCAPIHKFDPFIGDIVVWNKNMVKQVDSF